MIRILGLNKYYNKGRRNQIHVINNTNLELPDKGLVALLGPSGCGKTTLLNAIGGLDKVNKGNIYIDIVPTFNCNDTPAVYFDKRFLKFVNELDAEIELDIYALTE